MGSTSSKPLEALTKEEIAAAVSSLGANYEQYADAVIDNAIDGELLACLNDEDLTDTFDEIGVSSKLHRKVLIKTLNKSKVAATPAAVSAAVSSTHRHPPASLLPGQKDTTASCPVTMTSVCDQSELRKYADIAERILEEMGPNAHMAAVNLLSKNKQHSLSFTIRAKKGVLENVVGFEIPMGESLCKALFDSDKQNLMFRIPDDYYPLNAPNGDKFTGPHRYIGHILRDPTSGERVGTVCALESISPIQDETQEKENERLELLEELAIIAEEELKKGNALRYRNEILTRQIEETTRASSTPQQVAHSSLRPEEDIPSPNQDETGFQTCTADQAIFHQGLADIEGREHLPLHFFDDLDKAGLTHPPISKNDMERVAVVESLGLMNINARDPLLKSLNNLVSMAARLFGYQMGQISVHNHEKEFALCRYISSDLEKDRLGAFTAFYSDINSNCGIPFIYTKDRNSSICNYTIHARKTLVLNDTWNDKTFAWLENFGLFKAYVGSPIFNMDGQVIAILCIFDFKEVKTFNKTNEAQMEQIAFSISQLIENWALRKEMKQLERERLRLDHVTLKSGKTSPPRDEAAIVLTDVQGSTSLWEENPEAMQDALKVHDEIMRTCCKQNYGYEITTEGDAFLLAFHDAVDAIQFALQAQVALHEANWSADILKLPDAADDGGSFRGLRVRMGIHFGPVASQENEVTGRMEYNGETWNIAKHIEAMCHGGQVLVTADAWRVASWVTESLNSPQVVDVGEYVVSTGKTMHDGIISKRVMQLVPKQLAFDYFSSRRQSVVTCDESALEENTPGLDNIATLAGRTFPPPLSKRKLRASFYDAPYVNGEVTVAFIYTSEVKDSVEDPNSVLAALAKFFSSVLVEFDGYECKTGMYAFRSPAKAVRFGLQVMQALKARPVEGESNLARLLKVGVHSGVFTSMGPNPTTGRADYYGQVVNRAARVAGAASLGEVCVGVAPDRMESSSPPFLDTSIQTKYLGLKQLKGVSREIALFSCS